ncbi:MAG: ATP-binding protein [Chlorobi bacterium]|nr:ATP-binding protein [Chlorobiota bacterium]
MNAPFIFGKITGGKDFTDRENEIRHLQQNFLAGTNTILISPRRWGKSSLVKKAGDELEKANGEIKVVHIDMFNIRSEEGFYQALSEKTIKAVSGKLEDLIANSKKFLKQWLPKITFSPDAQNEISFGLNWTEVKKQPDEILNLPNEIAKDKGYQLIICIDEFQNLAFFDDPLAFQKRLRSHWQKHQKATYCLYGSKRHMLMEVFASPSMPFYKFGDMMFLEKIPGEYWKDFIQKRFRATGKKISKKQAGHIAFLVENHPHYVQQLAQLCWFRTDKVLEDGIIEEALDSLVLQLGLLFQGLTESLSTTQVNFLKALLDGVKMFSSKKTIEKYKLGTSANIPRIKNAMIKKEIIDDSAGKIEILDPIYSIWLRGFYFI